MAMGFKPIGQAFRILSQQSKVGMYMTLLYEHMIMAHSSHMVYTCHEHSILGSPSLVAPLALIALSVHIIHNARYIDLDHD